MAKEPVKVVEEVKEPFAPAPAPAVDFAAIVAELKTRLEQAELTIAKQSGALHIADPSQPLVAVHRVTPNGNTVTGMQYANMVEDPWVVSE